MLGGGPLSAGSATASAARKGCPTASARGSASASLDKVGPFLMFAISNPTNIDKVDAAIAEELAKFLKDGVSASELDERQEGVPGRT